MSFSYHTHVDPYFPARGIPFYAEDMVKLGIIEALVDVKREEDHHKEDGGSMVKRFTTGFMGEMAVEKLIGMQFIDWTIGRESLKYHISDLNKIWLDVGIKTVNYETVNGQDRFHLINREVSRPEIMVFLKGGLAYVMGIATIDVLRECRSDNLVAAKSSLSRKTGFWGYKYLKQFWNEEDIRQIICPAWVNKIW